MQPAVQPRTNEPSGHYALPCDPRYRVAAPVPGGYSPRKRPKKNYKAMRRALHFATVATGVFVLVALQGQVVEDSADSAGALCSAVQS